MQVLIKEEKGKFYIRVADFKSKRQQEVLKMELKYDDIFRISIWALRINRSYPAIPRDNTWKISFVVIHGFYFYVFCLLVNSTLFHDLKNNDFSAACTNGIFSVLFLCVSFKYTVLLTKSRDINTTIARMQHDYDFAKQLDVEEQAIVMEYAKTGNWATKVWLAVSCGTFSVFPTKVLILTIYHYALGEFRLIHMYDMTYPSVMEERKDVTYMYFALLFLQVYYGLYTLLMYIGFTPLGLIFMLHACGQLEIVNYRLRNLFKGQEDHYDAEVVKQRLKNIVKPLQEALEFIDLLKETFRVVYEMYLKATTIVFPIALYEIIQSFKEGQPSLEFMAFIVAGAVLCFAPCYYSDLLMEKGNSVRMSVYSCGWETFPDTSMRRTLVITLARLERDVAIRTLFRTVNLDAFSELCHQSYALFSVINAAWS